MKTCSISGPFYYSNMCLSLKLQNHVELYCVIFKIFDVQNMTEYVCVCMNVK